MPASVAATHHWFRRSCEMRGDLGTEPSMTNALKRLRADAYRLSLRVLLEERDEAAREIERLKHELERRSLEARDPPTAVPTPVKKGVRTTTRLVDPSLLRLCDVCQLVSLSRSSMYASIALGRFPRPVKVGTRSVRWRVEDIRNWIETPRIERPANDHSLGSRTG